VLMTRLGTGLGQDWHKYRSFGPLYRISRVVVTKGRHDCDLKTIALLVARVDQQLGSAGLELSVKKVCLLDAKEKVTGRPGRQRLIRVLQSV